MYYFSVWNDILFFYLVKEDFATLPVFRIYYRPLIYFVTLRGTITFVNDINIKHLLNFDFVVVFFFVVNAILYCAVTTHNLLHVYSNIGNFR